MSSSSKYVDVVNTMLKGNLHPAQVIKSIVVWEMPVNDKLVLIDLVINHYFKEPKRSVAPNVSSAVPNVSSVVPNVSVQYTCGVCNKQGHNARTCPHRNPFDSL